jgi:hypothetical protein
MLNLDKEAKYLVDRQASLHVNAVAWQPDMIVTRKRTDFRVEP